MLGRRRVFAVEPLGGRDGAAEDLAGGCIVSGVTSTYRRLPDAAHRCSLDSGTEDGELRCLERQVPLLKLASRDSGVEMAVGDSPLATSPGLSQDSLDFEPMGSPGTRAHLGQLLASHKLEQALERSHRLPTSPTILSRQHHSPQPPSKPQCEMPPFGAGQQKFTEAETDLEAGLEKEAVGDLGSGAWACLPGQGLRYLEHLCLVLEQMARLQQLCLQLQAQRPPAGPEEEELALAPLPLPSHTLGGGVQGPGELLSQTEDTVVKAASRSKAGMPSANLPRLPEAPVEPTHNFPSCQGHKDLSHWDRVKVLLNRIRWRSPRHPGPPAPPDGCGPRIESRDLPERPQGHPHQKTFMPSLVVRKQRAKNLSVC
ncbi:uncharacterized protein C8orf58 homolog isoform X1 [Cynocephalus volans]|uniref:uncharacterized protein C8orf58 homolog isoform X1 n=1 Tax=Cynocephalus volans TaxID=110931 RepID=UPI002FCA4D9C